MLVHKVNMEILYNNLFSGVLKLYNRMIWVVLEAKASKGMHQVCID